LLRVGLAEAAFGLAAKELALEPLHLALQLSILHQQRDNFGGA
jgi:hypothetical protein